MICSGLHQRVIGEAMITWHGRLRTCVRTDGLDFKHSFG